ncbi:MAG: threonine--tRNA ligase [Patescibacteria group bacterium]|nr:threonine--tRNA ligase [Patescibacteria group bacterium]
MSKNKESEIQKKRHSLSHVMAAAVLDIFDEARLAIGPAIENGFYYDFDLPRTLIPEDLLKIEAKMKEIISSEISFIKREEDAKRALKKEKASGDIYKAELITDLMSEGTKKVTYYKSGDFEDLCVGPHVNSTKDLRGVAFKLTKIAGAYWRGNEKNKMLQRIYAVAFENQKKLDDYLKKIEEAEKRDHRKLGQELDLFSFNDAAVGFVFWHPGGMILKNELVSYWRKEHLRVGYKEVETPIILNESLWHKSGHWDNYKDNMYFTKIDNQQSAIKPMNCPGGILIYKSRMRSYRDLPLRVAELGLVHRHELSGVLHGLFRVRSFVQDDAHIYCTEDQVEKELASTIKLIEKIYKKFGFKDYHIELSTRPQKSIGTDQMWNKAEKTMKKVSRDLNLKIKINEGDGAFYGPKFDFHINDSIGRTWQCGTIQLDFSMPERFELEYVGKDGKKKRPVMIHRTVLGSLERFIGILIEHYAGAFPLWLAPVQLSIISVGAFSKKYAKDVYKELLSEGYRVELRDENETVGKKIREAELQKIPYMIVVGEKEAKSESVAVRTLHDKKIKNLKKSVFMKEIKKELENQIE